MRAIALLVLFLVACGPCSDDEAWAQRVHPAYYSTRGFTVVGYQGYNFYPAGRCYWYTLQRGNTLYESCLMEWNGEIHEYGLRAVDAFRPGH